MANIRRCFMNGKTVDLPVWEGKNVFALYYNGYCVWKNGIDKPKYCIITIWNVENKVLLFPALTMGRYADDSGTITTEESIGVIEWGDGTEEEYNSANELEHTYENNGIYTVTLWTNITTLKYTKGNGTIPYYDSNGMNYESFRGRKDLIGIDTEKSLLVKCVSFMFQDCINLRDVNFNDLLTFDSSIYNGSTFKNCISLTKIEIPKATDFIAPSMFEGCSNLNSVIVRANSFGIGESAFYDCVSLETFDFRKCIHIDGFAIYNSGIKNINLGSKWEGTYEVGRAFYQNKFINVTVENNVNFKVLGDCLYYVNSKGNYGLIYCSNKSSGNIIIENGTTKIFSYAFYVFDNYPNGITSITFPNSLETIADNIFDSGHNGSWTYKSNDEEVVFNYYGTEEEWLSIIPNYRNFPTGNTVNFI